MFKKALAVVLSASMAIALIGCGSGNGTTKTNGGAGTVKTSEGEIKLGEYKGLVVYEDDVKVTEDSYQSTVDYLLSQDTTTELVEKGKVKKDSVVSVDYVGKIEVNGEKVAFDGGTASDQLIDIANDGANYIDNFVSVLKGHKVGDEFTEKLKFPETYTNTATVGDETIELAGKDVWFTYTVKGIQKSTTPELTDEWAKETFGTYGVTDIKSFEKYVKEQLYIQNVMGKVWEPFLETCEVVSYNEEEKESLVTSYNKNYETQLQSSYGVDLATYLEACSMSQEDWDKQVLESVESNLKQKMIFRAIAEKEKLVPSGEDYKAEAETLAEQNSVSVEELESQYGKGEVEYAILYQKVQKFIVDNVEVKEGSEPTTAAETTAETTTAK